MAGPLAHIRARQPAAIPSVEGIWSSSPCAKGLSRSIRAPPYLAGMRHHAHVVVEGKRDRDLERVALNYKLYIR